MTERNAEFIQAFEALKHEINRRAGRRSSSLELDLAADRDHRVARHERLIRHVRDVRNLLQHPQSKSAAVHVTPEFLAETKALVTALQNPPRAQSLCIPRGKLYVADCDQTVVSAADVMRAKKFSHVPILNERDVLVGVFNEAAIFDYFFSNRTDGKPQELTIRTILVHCRLDAGHTESFGFVAPSTTEDAIVAKLTTVAGPSTRIGALFVTASGKASEPITGMITPWDVLATRRSQRGA